MNMRIVVKVVYNIFGLPRDIMVRRFKVRFKETIDHFISRVIAVAAIKFMLDGKSFPTTATDRDRRRWLMSVSTVLPEIGVITYTLSLILEP
jgi:hypothetical protein